MQEKCVFSPHSLLCGPPCEHSFARMPLCFSCTRKKPDDISTLLHHSWYLEPKTEVEPFFLPLFACVNTHITHQLLHCTQCVSQVSLPFHSLPASHPLPWRALCVSELLPFTHFSYSAKMIFIKDLPITFHYLIIKPRSFNTNFIIKFMIHTPFISSLILLHPLVLATLISISAITKYNTFAPLQVPLKKASKCKAFCPISLVNTFSS